MRVVNRSQQARVIPLPAPVGGLNARDNTAAMPPTDAEVMTNLFPYANKVATRAGFSVLGTATTTAPGGALNSRQGFRQLMMWSAQGTETPLGAWVWGENVAGSIKKKLRIYSIAANGTLTNSKEVVTTGNTDQLKSLGEWTQFTSASGTTYLFFLVTITVGGVDTLTPTAYDGTSWTTPTITGVPADTIGSHSHRNRLWFYGSADNTNAPKGLSAYYLPVGAIAGAAVEFNVGPYASRGGRICAMRTWTLDGGTGGTDDLAVFLTDRGQAIVYQGTDPASSATWSLVGVFNVGYPASGYAPYPSASPSNDTKLFLQGSFALKYGADLLFLLSDGVNSAAKLLRPGAEGTDYTISGKIRPLITDLAVANGTFGSTSLPWKMAYMPSRRQLLVSAVTNTITTAGPGVTTTTVTGVTVYAMNAENGSWTKFSGMNILDMLPVGDELYFIDGGQNIYKYGLAADDAGTAITYECRQAYNYLNSPNNKLVPSIQPMLRSTGNFSLTVEADADYNPGTISAYTSYTVAVEQNLQPWITTNKYGKAIAPHLKGQTSVGVVSWYATNVTVREGNFL